MGKPCGMQDLPQTLTEPEEMSLNTR